MEFSWKAMRRRPLVWIAVCWAAGCAAGLGCTLHWAWWLIPAAGFGIVCAGSKRFAALCAAIAFLGGSAVSIANMRPERMPVTPDCAVSGTVCAEVRHYEDSDTLVLRDVTLNGEPYAYKVRINLYRNGEETLPIVYGDRVETIAKLRTPAGVTGEGGYDSALHLWRQGIALTGSASYKKTALTPGGFSPMRALMELRESIGYRLDALYGENAPVARALLLGDKTGLDDGVYDAFRTAGIVHLLAVSGLHVSLLAHFVQWVLMKGLRVSRRISLAVVSAFLLVYAAVTGFPASILRAAICFVLIEAAPLAGRPHDGLTGLAAAFLCLTVFTPLRIADTGLQLSFLSVAGIMTVGSAVTRRTQRAKTSPGKLAAKAAQTAGISLGAALGTLVPAASAFGSVTLWSLVTNILVIPLTSLFLPVVALSTVVGLLRIPANMYMELLQRIALAFSTSNADLRVPVAAIPAGLAWVYLTVLLLSGAQFPFRRRISAWKRGSVAAVLMIAIAAGSNIWTQARNANESGLMIRFMDVGQGDSALIDAQGTFSLVDTGAYSAGPTRLRSRGIRLKYVFLTHPDTDHVGALADVLECGAPEKIILPCLWDVTDVPDETAALLERYADRCEYVTAGDVIRLSEDVTCTVLHPSADSVIKADNDVSLVLLVEYGDGSCLLMGDLDDDSIDFAMPDCDVLKAAHHGSNSSTGTMFLLEGAPSATVLSVGINGYGHPADALLERMDRMEMPYYRTDERGDIDVRLETDGTVTVTGYLEESDA